jgi:hypothetical protein
MAYTLGYIVGIALIAWFVVWLVRRNRSGGGA